MTMSPRPFAAAAGFASQCVLTKPWLRFRNRSHGLVSTHCDAKPAAAANGLGLIVIHYLSKIECGRASASALSSRLSAVGQNGHCEADRQRRWLPQKLNAES